MAAPSVFGLGKVTLPDATEPFKLKYGQFGMFRQHAGQDPTLTTLNSAMTRVSGQCSTTVS